MTSNANRWLLPDGVDEILPPRADQLETLRRELLDLYRSWGYDLIKTPLIEFLDSLLIVPSHELQLSTFKIVDQLSGKSMGVRADISSQAARIDAHVLQKDGPVRLCYADSVLRTRPSGPLGTRCPQLIGAEFYGHAGSEADVEIISLMLHTLRLSGIDQPLLALGHTAISRTLLKVAKLPGELESRLFTAMQNKASADITQLLAGSKIDRKLAKCLAQLPNLHGDANVLKQAARLLKGIAPAIDAALANLLEIATAVGERFPGLNLFFDLCELGGYEYHTGVIFSAYVAGHGEAIAKGGRYDALGEVFGRARPATGFDADLKNLLNLSKRRFPTAEKIYAPAVADASLDSTVLELRLRGQVVVQAFAGRHKGKNKDQLAARELGCTQQLVKQQGRWMVVPLL
jgi:ATP phosphoribosyltransferase regulatory subunit